MRFRVENVEKVYYVVSGSLPGRLIIKRGKQSLRDALNVCPFYFYFSYGTGRTGIVNE